MMEKLYFNGKIIPITRSEPEAVLISDGKIKKTGKLADVRAMASSSTEEIDLQGKCMMPSFIDSHSHMIMNGQMSVFADLTACSSFEQIITVLKEYIASHSVSDREVVIGYGYDHNFLKEKRHPDRFVLDKVSQEIPVLLIHISAHMACANSMSLKLSGIDENTKNPPGGLIGKSGEGSEPNGYLEEAALALVQKAIKRRFPYHADKIAEGMQDDYIKRGITTIQEGAATETELKLLKWMADTHQLKADVVAYPLITTQGAELIKRYSDFDRSYRNHLKIGGYKLILDGSPQGRTAWMSEPYLEGEKDYCGYPYLEDAVVEKYVMQAIKEERQLLVHCNGDAASEQFLRIYEKCMAENKVDLRPVMVHCQTVREDQIDRMARIPMIASVFIGHVWYWGDIHLRNFGKYRGEHISPVKDAVERGVIVNFHQDAPVTKPDMLQSVWCAVNRISRGGKTIGRQQKISVGDALKAITYNAAYQYFEEDIKGSIEEGKNADFVLLDRSPLEVSPLEIKDIEVLETIKEGETIYEA